MKKRGNDKNNFFTQEKPAKKHKIFASSFEFLESASLFKLHAGFLIKIVANLRDFKCEYISFHCLIQRIVVFSIFLYFDFSEYHVLRA